MPVLDATPSPVNATRELTIEEKEIANSREKYKPSEHEKDRNLITIEDALKDLRQIKVTLLKIWVHCTPNDTEGYVPCPFDNPFACPGPPRSNDDREEWFLTFGLNAHTCPRYKRTNTLINVEPLDGLLHFDSEREPYIKCRESEFDLESGDHGRNYMTLQFDASAQFRTVQGCQNYAKPYFVDVEGFDSDPASCEGLKALGLAGCSHNRIEYCRSKKAHYFKGGGHVDYGKMYCSGDSGRKFTVSYKVEESSPFS